MSQGSSTVPPPPSGDPAGDIQGAGDGGGMDKFRSLVSRLSGGGTPAIDKALQQHHDQVVADAQRHAASAKQYYGMIAKAKATGKNPVTGQPVTPEEMQQWQQQADGAWADYSKIAGKAKGAKPIIQQMGGMLKHITGGGGGGGGQAQGQPQGQQGGQPPARQGSPTVAPPPQGEAAKPAATVPPPPSAGNPLQESAQQDYYTQAMKDQSARGLKDEEYRDKLKADIDPHLQPPHVNSLKQEIDDIVEAEPGISRDDAIRKAEQKLQITPKPGAAKLKTGWGKDEKGFYSFQIGPDNHPVAGSEDHSALPPASYLEHTREGFHYITDDDGNVHEIPNQSKSGVAIPGKSGGKSSGMGGSGGSSSRPSGVGGDRVVGHTATSPQKKVEQAADALETEARKVDQYVAHPSPTNDTALLFSYVRAQVAGAGRMTNTEIALALKAGSWGTQLKNHYDRATTGMLDPTFRGQAAESVKTAAKAARDEADKYRKPPGSVDAPPGSTGKFTAPKDAPPAPKADGHKLKANGKVIAVSKGGQWVAP